MNIIKISYDIETSYKTNRVLYLLKHIKYLNKAIPDSIYGDFHFKKALGIIVNILGLLKELFLESLYLLIFVWLPINFFSHYASGSYAFSNSINIIFFLSCILGPLQESEIFKITDVKYVCIKYMRVDVKSYIVQNLLQRVAIHSFLLIILMYYLFMPLKMTIFQFFFLAFCIIGFKFIGEAIHLIIFEKAKLVICEHWLFLIPLFALCLFGAYEPLIYHSNPGIDKIIYSFPFLIFVGILLVLSLLYITVGYRKYNSYSFLRAYKSQNLISEIVTQELNRPTSKYTFGNKKLFVDQNDKKYYHLKGIDFVNAIFFSRYKKYFRKHITIRIIIIFIITIVGFLFYRNYPLSDLFNLLPFIVICISFLNISDQYCRTFYFDCDRMFLAYSPFRDIRVLKRSYIYRLKKICSFNFIIGSVTFLALTLFSYYTHTLNIENIVMMFFAIILAYMFYSVYSVSTYFLFQPYENNFRLNIKTISIATLTSPLYLTCFILYSQKLICILIELVLVISYFIISLILLPYLSPKFMRIK